jgi:hypothetical protein
MREVPGHRRERRPANRAKIDASADLNQLAGAESLGDSMVFEQMRLNRQIPTAESASWH